MTKFNRLDPEYLKEWRQKFYRISNGFAVGTLTLAEAESALRALNFKDEALEVEILELRRTEAKTPRLKLVS